MPSSPVVHLSKRKTANVGVWRADLLRLMFPDRPDLHEISIQTLAPKVGMHWRALYRVLRGDTRLRLESAGDISQALKMTPTQLAQGVARVAGVNPTVMAQAKYRREAKALEAVQRARAAAKPSKARKTLPDVWVDVERKEAL